MNRHLKAWYPALVALGLALALLLDGALFIMALAASIACLPLAYAQDSDDIARRVREADAARRLRHDRGGGPDRP
jgi:hypothetical protein